MEANRRSSLLGAVCVSKKENKCAPDAITPAALVVFATLVLEVTEILSVAPAASEVRLMHPARLRRAVPHGTAIEINAEILVLPLLHELDERFILAIPNLECAREACGLLKRLGKLVGHPQRGESTQG